MIGVVILITFSLSIWIVVAENEKTDIQDSKIWNSTKMKVAIAGGLISTAFGITLLSVFWHRWRKKIRTPLHVDYPAYGITGPSKLNSATDSKLAQNAQLFQYDHKKQIFSQEKDANQDKSVDSEEEEVGNGYSVFECPGLAETGEMEVQNPMFIEKEPK